MFTSDFFDPIIDNCNPTTIIFPDGDHILTINVQEDNTEEQIYIRNILIHNTLEEVI